MVETDVKPVTIARTLKDGEKLVVNGVEIEIVRKRRHERQVRVKVKYQPKAADDLDTLDNNP